MFDYIIITHLPVFYKINLYNELAKKINIHVIFVGADTNEKRSDDFNILNKSDFSYTLLHDSDFQSRNKLKTCIGLIKVLNKLSFKKLIVGGWDLPEFWCAIMIAKKHQNCLALESTILDSAVDGYRGVIKKVFLSRISSVFASGSLHIELLNKLGYTNGIKKTLGVGIINDISAFSNIKPIDINYNRRFLFVGRLTAVKNLTPIIQLFKDFPQLKLTVIGTGEDEAVLKSIGASNVDFKGAVDNKQLSSYFENHDFLLLPSLQEPWGLVIEESLNYNTPVIISDRCGSVELIEHGKNGLIFSPLNDKELVSILTSIDQSIFNELVAGATEFSIRKKDDYQVRQYIELI